MVCGRSPDSGEHRTYACGFARALGLCLMHMNSSPNRFNWILRTRSWFIWQPLQWIQIEAIIHCLWRRYWVYFGPQILMTNCASMRWWMWMWTKWLTASGGTWHLIIAAINKTKGHGHLAFADSVPGRGTEILSCSLHKFHFYMRHNVSALRFGPTEPPLTPLGWPNMLNDLFVSWIKYKLYFFFAGRARSESSPERAKVTSLACEMIKILYQWIFVWRGGAAIAEGHSPVNYGRSWGL